MRAIITGVTGQDGSHLSDLLLSKGYDVIGIARRTSTDNTKRIKHLLSHPSFKVVEGDITDISSIYNVLNNTEHVDEIYNLAAQSHVATSFKQPALTWDITGKGCMNILQAIVALGLHGIRFYQASSSEMFGSSYDISANGDKYQNEDTKFMPNSPYAISKCAAHHAVRLFRNAYNLHASCGILFNHEGPRRGDDFVTQKIIKWIAKFVKWRNSPDNINRRLAFTEQHICFTDPDFPLPRFPKLRLGNLEAFRDWGYAGDYVQAMWLMLQQQYPDDYVICTGETHTIAEFLDIAFNYAGLPEWRDFIYIDPEFYRPSEVDYLRGDCSKAHFKLGWKAQYNLEGLVKLMLDAQL
jgi:GDPmannose 4,6-dehydratase